MDISSKDILQIDATIVTGILILVTISPIIDLSLFDQSQIGIRDPFQTYNELSQLNETELNQYMSEFVEEQATLNKEFFTNPLWWACSIGILFSISATLAAISLVTKGDLQNRQKQSSLIAMIIGFVMFYAMFALFAFTKL